MRTMVAVLALSGLATPALRAFPAELVLTANESDSAATPADLRLLTREPIPDLIVEPDVHSSEAIAVEHGEVAPSGRLVHFTVRLRPGATLLADRVSLVVRSASDPSIRLTIPVTIRRAGTSP